MKMMRGLIEMRLDNTSKEVIAYYELKFNPNDPGETLPVDLCWDCHLGLPDFLLIDHPDYRDGKYYCFECKKPLTLMDCR